jgi:hypothetical protein
LSHRSKLSSVIRGRESCPVLLTPALMHDNAHVAKGVKSRGVSTLMSTDRQAYKHYFIQCRTHPHQGRGNVPIYSSSISLGHYVLFEK